MSHFNFYYSSIFPVKAVRIPQATLDVADTEKQITYNKNTVTAAFRLARLEIWSRNEETINSTRNMIYSLKVWFFYFLLYLGRYFLFVSELI